MSQSLNGRVLGVNASRSHVFSKARNLEITIVAGLGVEGDAHSGATVKHRSRVARDKTAPNLRQVHLLQSELFVELAAKGFRVTPGDIGENITTAGIDLLALPEGTELAIGDAAVVRLTGLRNPCSQIDKFSKGLMHAVLDRAPDGTLVRKAGVMSIALAGGAVRPGDAIVATLPQAPHRALQPV